MHKQPRNHVITKHMQVNNIFTFTVLLNRNTTKGSSKHVLLVNCAITGNLLYTRTVTTNGAAFLWFNGIADVCNAAGRQHSVNYADTVLEPHFYRGAVLAYAHGRLSSI